MRFGVFEVDLGARELRKRGIRQRLQDQPFRVLEALLEKPGEIVTREELKERLWAQDEFVEFDKSLNTAIQKIRQALDDSATSPRFLETVTKVGYRFLAPVQLALPVEPNAPIVRPLWPVAAACVVALAVAGWWRFSTSPETVFDPTAYRLRQLTRNSGLTFQPALSQDGKLIAYASDHEGQGNLDIYIQQVSGGSPSRITDHPADDYQPHFSPGGDQVIFRSDREGGGIYLAKPFGDDSARLVAPKGRAPRLSPDGKDIVFQRGFRPVGTTLHVADLATGAETRIAPELRIAFSPIWAPDGQAILFWGSTSGFTQVDWWSADTDGGPATPMGAYEKLGPAGIQAPVSPHVVNGPVTLFPGGQAVLFAARSGDDSRLWRIPFDSEARIVSGDPTPVTLGSSKPIEPSVAETGTIAFEQLEDRYDIVSLPVDGSRQSVETVVSDVAPGALVAISRDGSRVAYPAVRGGQTDVYVTDLNSGETIAITDTPDRESYVLMSPDGALVIYHLGSVGNRRVMLAPVAGGPATELCSSCARITGWSSDSRRILGDWSRQSQELVERDTSSGATTRVLARSERPLWNARYSPDDHWISFLVYTEEGQGRKQFIAEIRGAELAPEADWISISQGHLIEGYAEWSTGGDALYYWSSGDPDADDEALSLWKQPLDPMTKRPMGSPVHLIHLPEYRRWPVSQSQASPWLAVSDDRIIFKLADLKGNIWLMEPQAGEQ